MVLVVAVGVGAAAAVVVGWQSGRVATGSAETSALEGSKLETTSAAKATKDTTLGTASYKHNIGVWYEGGARKWAIFNQDRAAVPSGATFEVVVPRASARFVHHARLVNTAGNYTYLDDRLTNGEPDAVLSVTQNWNPGGGRGVYNDHPVDTVYDAQVERWTIYNRDNVSIPKGAAFNIAVSAGTD